MTGTETDQDTIATLRRRLSEAEAERDSAATREAALAEVLDAINNSSGDLKPVFNLILEKAIQLCSPAVGALSTFDGESYHVVASIGYPPAYADHLRVPWRSSQGGLSELIMLGDSYIHNADIGAETAHLARSSNLRAMVELGHARTVVWAALRKDDRLLGLFTLYRKEVRPFSDREIGLIRRFAGQAVLAMENARLLDELASRNNEFGERIEQQSATIDVLKAMSESPGDTRPVFDLIVRRASELCESRAAITRMEGGSQHLRAIHGFSPEAERAWTATFPRKPTLDQVTGRAIIGKRVVHVRDIDADPAVSGGTRLLGGNSSLAVPLLYDNEAIGTIGLNSDTPNGFSSSQIALLQTFAEQAVIAIGTAATYRALEERTKELARRQAELSITFENMGDGVAMFDETPRLVAWNRNFQDIFEVPENLLRERRTYAGYIHFLAERGDFGPNYDPVESLRRFAQQSGQYHAHERTRADGRVIEIRHNPVRGGGFVLIFSDITERKRNEAEIRAARDAAEEASRTIEAAYRDLKVAQANLVQAEKMASLGQLTAGIAHEIKNPLNFVNNFASLSIELLDEFKETVQPALTALDEELRTDVAYINETLTQNLGKVLEHGRRADGIVRSMLEHSRGASGERRTVDLNELTDEALNLAFHGARARDQGFQVTLERDFAAALPPIEVNPGDLTRVFLNLFTNGFYATRMKQSAGESGFEPRLRVTTRDLGPAVEIRVRDNGTGIPEDIRDKLFQPFFTTKPSGEGTGLGLSITYDVVTQQHGGTIQVDSTVGEFTEFTVTLPRVMAAPSGNLRPATGPHG